MAARSWWGEELLGHGANDAVWAGAGVEVTMGRLRTEVSWLATVLGHHGIRSGSTVALRGVPSFTQLWAIFACWSLGAQVILLERRVTRPALTSLLESCAPQFYLTFGEPSTSRHLFVNECAVLVRALPGGRPAGTPHCLIQFSSGTTGRMKATGRTPESLFAELARMHDLAGLAGPGERLLLLDSITSSFGLIGGVLRGLDVGHPVRFATTEQPAAALGTADVVIGTPRHYGALAAVDPGTTVPPRLRTAISSGDILPTGVADRFHQRFGVPIGQAYGLTETGLVAADLTGRHPSPYVGRPVPGIRTRITGGMLEVHVVQSPYLGEDDLSNGGWLATHDLVSQDPVDGTLRLRGRFVPTTAAEHQHVDLLRIESVLRMHHQVRAAVVLGADDRLEAHVAGPAELDQFELTAWCHRFLGAGATPARYHVLPDLPTTFNGKFLRSRELLIAHGTRFGQPSR